MDQAEKDLINDYKKLFGTPEGKRVLASICQVSGYDESYRMPIASNNPQEVGFVLGMREIAWYIKSQLVRDPDAEQPEQTDDQENILS